MFVFGYPGILVDAEDYLAQENNCFLFLLINRRYSMIKTFVVLLKSTPGDALQIKWVFVCYVVI